MGSVNRSQAVLTALKASQGTEAFTAQEITKAANLNPEDAKHVSSILWGFLRRSLVRECEKRQCTITGRSATTYRFVETAIRQNNGTQVQTVEIVNNSQTVRIIFKDDKVFIETDNSKCTEIKKTA